MKKVVHKAESRGYANHGWLESHHSFSFAGYYNPERMQFGTLRVLNDDRVAPAGGFGTHPHHDMEIISIPLKGALEHRDSLGNTAVIREGDVQVMSAGTGVRHSEYNHYQDREVAFLQIWIMPDEAGVAPRYGQVSIDPKNMENQWLAAIGPRGKHDGLWIHQKAWLHLGRFEKGEKTSYSLKEPGNGLYIFVLEGSLRAAGELLDRRDALGVWETDAVDFEMSEASEVLLLEIPMER
ncbi:pirin family protein [Robiginitalea marina]|uniref:Pirin family protein n=1 Tax=Robiginitalea marina TaxID=2954105 RepID=A0ABT1AXI8_9FLAO|nr:pirin family protein [Robiginitalea marina]MCO5724758.1 pirin family protein [Robiginitalea marina]